jgi:hypothetical protein
MENATDFSTIYDFEKKKVPLPATRHWERKRQQAEKVVRGTLLLCPASSVLWFHT